ncbi:MAG: hypothetical protein D6772_17795 [Bacteroidetes bacterium]|nr:MAG: hypothetical protein D6772_17795 [Bacteroidota bacterium]
MIMSYQLRRNERRNRTKAVVITIMIYASLTAWLILGQDLSLSDVVSSVWQPEVEASAVANTEEVRP